MNKDEVFSIWAAEGSTWSRWVKPVLFAHIDLPGGDETPVGLGRDAGWAPAPEGMTALVLDLPGAHGVELGVALAVRGYRPVPLYNAIPAPFGEKAPGRGSSMAGASVTVVNVIPIIRALQRGAEKLAKARLFPEAPPAFLLDANRRGAGARPRPRDFDNRAVCSTADFPSGEFLLAKGIARALLVERGHSPPQPDLAQVLRRWRAAGLVLERVNLDDPLRMEVFEVTPPPWYGAFLQRAFATLGLRRARGGGFGGWTPESPSAG
jgi:hypothetical protein